MRDQGPLSNAFRAAFTARSMSALSPRDVGDDLLRRRVLERSASSASLMRRRFRDRHNQNAISLQLTQANEHKR